MWTQKKIPQRISATQIGAHLNYLSAHILCLDTEDHLLWDHKMDFSDGLQYPSNCSPRTFSHLSNVW